MSRIQIFLEKSTDYLVFVLSWALFCEKSRIEDEVAEYGMPLQNASYWAAIAAATVAAAQLTIGAIQRKKAKKLAYEAMKNRPKRGVSEGLKDAVKSAEKQASAKLLPGQDAIEEKIAASTSRGVEAISRTASSPTDASAIATSLYANEQNALADLGVEAKNNYNANQQMLRSIYGTLGMEQQLNWDWNEKIPNEGDREAAIAMSAAGAQNMWGGFDTAAGAAAMYGGEAGGQGGTKSGSFTEAANSSSTFGENIPYSELDTETQQKMIQGFFVNKGDDPYNKAYTYNTNQSLVREEQKPIHSDGGVRSYVGLPSDVQKAMNEYYGYK